MPTTRRDRRGGAPRRLRALTTVAALYALVLQALLGGIAALPVAGAPGLLCASIGGESRDASDKAGLPGPDVHDAGCCTAANQVPAAAPPPAAATAIAWTERASTRAAWGDRHRPAARPPPFTLAHARAPPAA